MSDEDDIFGRIAFDLVLNPFEMPYANQAAAERTEPTRLGEALEEGAVLTIQCITLSNR